MPILDPLPPGVEAHVSQRPVSVELECPACGHEHSWSYDEFTGMYGDPPDWEGETIACPNCGENYRIDGQDWD